MFTESLNHVWSRAVVEELVRCGCTRWLLSPGSRNTPLVLAADANERAECEVLIDERGAAFKALGWASATGRAAVLVCTSGTAVANYLPAVVEASRSATPLIVLSADRPVELREAGANQTIDQVGIFSSYTRWSFDLAAPRGDVPLASVLTAVDQLAYRAHRWPAGPVQLNCQFAEPLAPEPPAPGPPSPAAAAPGTGERLLRWQASGRPWTRYAATASVPARADIDRAASLLQEGKRGVIIAGRLPAGSDAAPVLDLARRLRMPLLADIASGLRFGAPSADAVLSHHDHFLKHEALAAANRPDVVLHLGGPLVSSALMRFVEQAGADYLLVDRTPWRQDPDHVVTLRLEMDPLRFCADVPVAPAARESGLLAPLTGADAVCARVLAKELPEAGLANEEAIAYRVLEAVPAGCGLFLGNSMPVRDAEACGVRNTRDIRIGVNRGASGIDGTLAAASGFAEGLARRTVLIVGDLAFLHDLNSLAVLAGSARPVIVVLVNNDGGGIFSFLPVAGATDRFEACFGAAHGLRFGAVVASFGLDHHQPGSAAEFAAALAAALETGRSAVIEVRTDRARNASEHRRLQQAIDDALAGAFH